MDVNMNKHKKKPLNVTDMTQEQIRQAIIKKNECNTKAQQIIESLLEKCITESYLLQCLPDINQAHLVDVIEERSIVLLCGYPICDQALSVRDIPKQKYRISLKTNKVYDITFRKKFCSNSCYNAAMYLKKQMLTSPLWAREYEEIPNFHLLPLNSTGSIGEEIDVSITNKIEIKPENSVFTSINDFAKASLNEIHGDDEKSPEENKVDVKDEVLHCAEKQLERKTDETELKNQNNTSSVVEKSDIEVISASDKLAQLSLDKKKNAEPNPLNIVGEIVEKAERKIDPILIEKVKTTPKESKSKKVVQKKQPPLTVLIIEIEKCLAEWFTLDTMLFLFGVDKVREMVTEKKDCVKEYLDNYSKGIFYNANSYDQYQQLCKKLNMLEIEDRRHDAQTLQKETKPLPDYRILQEESKKMQLKVKAFLAGQSGTVEPDPVKQDSSITPDCNVTQLPLGSANSQNALRRGIVGQQLNKVLPDILRSLGLLTHSISSDMRLLVNTFKLKANNIMFKPLQWNLIAIVFIKLLSIRDKRLEYLLVQPIAFKHMQLLLLSYKQDGGYLDRLLSWLTDIDRLLDTNDTQLTIE